MASSMEEQSAVERKRWWLAGIFSFVVPGLGQIYNSEAIKGMVFYLLIVILNFIFFTYLGHHLEDPGLMTRHLVLSLLFVFCIMLLFYLLSIVDAIRSAVKSRPGRRLKFYNRWSVYVSILVVFCSLNFLTPGESGLFGATKAYKVPSGSMLPTIEIGDHVICNRMYYRSHNPQREDIIIFQNSKDENKDYIKRIVGIPGDTIELRQNTLFVNGRAVDEPYAQYIHNGPMPQSYGPYFIPENQYFVMGDNRNNSKDSRYYGTIERECIQGRAFFIYFSWDMDIHVWNLPARLASIRFSRIGKIL